MPPLKKIQFAPLKIFHDSATLIDENFSPTLKKNSGSATGIVVSDGSWATLLLRSRGTFASGSNFPPHRVYHAYLSLSLSLSGKIHKAAFLHSLYTNTDHNINTSPKEFLWISIVHRFLFSAIVHQFLISFIFYGSGWIWLCSSLAVIKDSLLHLHQWVHSVIVSLSLYIVLFLYVFLCQVKILPIWWRKWKG